MMQTDDDMTADVEVATEAEAVGAGESKGTASTDAGVSTGNAATGNNAAGIDGNAADVATAALAGSDRKIKTLQDVIDRLGPLETEEQRRKRERREKSAKIVSAVSDGLSALGNLYFTSQYAPDMYSHEKGSQLRAQNAAIERARKEREANRDAHLRYALALGDAENERAKTVREIEAEEERRRLAQEKAQRDAEQHGWLAALQPDKQREQKGKADKAEQEALTAKAEADYAPSMQQAKLDTEYARGRSYDASAGASAASASLSRTREGKIKADAGYYVDTEDGGQEWIPDYDLDRYFTELDDDARKKAGNPTAYGYSKPTKAQKRQALAEKRDADLQEAERKRSVAADVRSRVKSRMSRLGVGRNGGKGSKGKSAASGKSAGAVKPTNGGKLANTRKLGL